MKSLKANQIERNNLEEKEMQHITGANTKECVVAAVGLRVWAGLRPWTTDWQMPRPEFGPGTNSQASNP